MTVFDANTGSQIKKVKFQYEVNELQWTANSDHLLIATAGADSGSIDIIKFNGEELFLVDTIAAHTSNCFSLKVDSAVFRRMAVGSGDFNVSLWDLGDMVCHHTLPFDSAVRSLAFSGDGRFLAIAPDSQALITVADVDKGCEVVKVDCKGSVVALSWHPKLPLIALALDDRPVTGGTVTNTQYMRLLSIPQNYVK